MKKLIYIFLLWPVLAWAVPKPVHYQTVAEDTVWEGSRWTVPWAQTRVGAELMFFDSLGAWKNIRNGWTVTGTGVNRRWVSNGDVLKTDVHYNGTTTFSTTMNGISTVMTHKPNRIILENQQTGVVTTLTGLSFGTLGAPTVIGDTLRYTKFSGAVVYEIIKKNATVTHRITFNPTCLSSALSAYNLLPSQPEIALSVESDYTFTNIANPTGTVWETELKDFGNTYKLLMERQWASDGKDSVIAGVQQGWQIGKMRERLMMGNVSAVVAQNANAVIRHNDQTSIGAAGIEDARVYEYTPNNNCGASAVLQLYVGAGYNLNSLIRVLDVDGALGAGATISAASCSLFCVTNVTDGNVSAYRILKPWIEGTSDNVDPDAPSGGGGATWPDWDADPSEWGTAGCANASDAGADNNSDGSGYDRWATAESSVNVTTVNTWYSWAISAVVAQGWYNLTMNENGIVLIGPYNNFASTENATVANRPRFSFTYSVSGGGAAANNVQIILVE